jgi:lysophospholipase L1-like esterase
VGARLIRALLLALLVSCTGPTEDHARNPTIACMGDSITAGVIHSSSATAPTEIDPEGGYPGRLQALLGDRAHVLGRGIGGATTTLWLAPFGAADQRQTIWQALHSLHWNDFPPSETPAAATSVFDAVLVHDRPDVVVLLIGTNDLRVPPFDNPDVVARTADGIDRLVRDAQTHAHTVLVATLLPQRLAPAERVDRMNDRIRAAYPDYLPLGERFAAAGWEHLLGDDIHPNQAGYAVLARTLADELTARGVVSR